MCSSLHGSISPVRLGSHGSDGFISPVTYTLTILYTAKPNKHGGLNLSRVTLYKGQPDKSDYMFNWYGYIKQANSLFGRAV